MEPLKCRLASAIVKAWNILNSKLTHGGHITKHYIIGNECNAELKKVLTKNELTFELTPPNMHRRNAAERSIRTFKSYFLAGLATCNPNFPIMELDRLLHQSELTLNLLRTSRVNPTLFFYAYLFGNFDFNKTPLAPIGTKLVIHAKPNKRDSWSFHGEDGWYIGPAMDHYRCITCYIPSTFKTRFTDTATLIPHNVPIPTRTVDDHLRKVSSDVIIY